MSHKSVDPRIRAFIRATLMTARASDAKGRWIKRHRKWATQKQLAKFLGVSQSTICRIVSE